MNEELLNKIGEPDNFWAKLKGFVGQQPGVQAGVPPGLQAVYEQAQPVWQPFGKLTPEEEERAGLTLEQRQKATAAFDIPEAAVSNIAFRTVQPMHTTGRPELQGWKGIKESVVDAVQGRRYGSFLDVFKMSMLSPGEAQAWGEFVDKYRIGKVADTAAEIGMEMAAGAIIEAGIAYGAKGAVKGLTRGVETGAAGIRGLIKGMFDDVPVHYLVSGNIDDAVDEVLERKQIYTEALANLRSKKFSGVEGVTTWADIGNDIMEYAAEEGMVVRGIWPAQPTEKQIRDIAKHFGVKIRKMSEVGGRYKPETRTIKLGKYVFKGGGVHGHSYYITAGDVVLHELGHDIYFQMPIKLREEWARFYQDTLKIMRALEPVEKVHWTEGTIRKVFGTRYATTNSLEFFADIFFLINSKQAEKVPERVAYKYIDLMREAGVPYIDVKDIVKRSIRHEFIAKLTKERVVFPSEVEKMVQRYSGGVTRNIDDLTNEQFNLLVQRVRNMVKHRYEAFIGKGK